MSIRVQCQAHHDAATGLLTFTLTPHDGEPETVNQLLAAHLGYQTRGNVEAFLRSHAVVSDTTDAKAGKRVIVIKRGGKSTKG